MDSLYVRRLKRWDRALTHWMGRWGHFLDRWCLGLFFIWLGTLKILGYKSATSLIARTVYFFSPETAIPLLGGWEVGIGICLIVSPLVRLALLLMLVRLPGTVLALWIHSGTCFVDGNPLIPTVIGQYLIKDFLLFSAGMVIAGTLKDEWEGEDLRSILLTVDDRGEDGVWIEPVSDESSD